jgi:hypothetical protein
MIRDLTVGQLIGIILIGGLILITPFVIFKTIKKVTKPKEITQNVGVNNKGFRINIKGDYVTYIKMNKKYKDMGAKAYDADGNDISDDIIVSYFNNGTQVFGIDTTTLTNYVVKYEIEDNGLTKETTRVVIVNKS